jgi:hypothetical protein
VCGIRRYQKSSAVARLTLPIANAFVEHIAEFVNHVGIQDGGGTTISIEYFPPEKILSIPRDATAFYQRGTWIDWHAMIGYGQRAELDEWVTEWAQRLVDHIVKLEKEDQDIPDSIKARGTSWILVYCRRGGQKAGFWN